MKTTKSLRITIAITAILTAAFGTFVGVQTVTGGLNPQPTVDAVKVGPAYVTGGDTAWPKGNATAPEESRSGSEPAGSNDQAQAAPSVASPTPQVEEPTVVPPVVIATSPTPASSNSPASTAPANPNGFTVVENSTFVEPGKK